MSNIFRKFFIAFRRKMHNFIFTEFTAHFFGDKNGKIELTSEAEVDAVARLIPQRLKITIKDVKKNTKYDFVIINDCSKDNDVVQAYIIEGVNSYGKDYTGSTHRPLYKLILDSNSNRVCRSDKVFPISRCLLYGGILNTSCSNASILRFLLTTLAPCSEANM